MSSMEIIDDLDDYLLEFSQPFNGKVTKSKRDTEEPADSQNKKKKKKLNQTIKNFVQHVCSPISNEKRRRAVAFILQPSHKFSSDELDQIWQGMFFVVFYTEVSKCEEILYDIAYGCRFTNEKDYLLAGFKLLAKEWMGIDFFRVDKYALLIRHMINRSLRIAILESEPRDYNFLEDIFVISNECVELLCHIFEIYLEELNNVTMRQVIWKPVDKSDVYVASIKPVIKTIPRNTDARVLATIKESIFKEIDNMLSSDCEWKDRFCQLTFKELIEAGKEENVSAKTRKSLFKIAQQFKDMC